ncbi:hypothetical protein [Streptomyces venezuelae]|uniref:hypothetical protein n=1 Tax=Streptomyces venezuelae TaxID=54571 RepID=UPI00278C286E|nr:hypothetical protein [Streptomyces venezuelae]
MTGPVPVPASASGTGTHSVGPHLVISSAETAAALAPVLDGLPPLPGTLLVLAAAPDAAPFLRGTLPDLVLLARERGASRLLLAASGLAAPGPDGARPVSAVATAADFTVIAPDGVASVEPDGTLRLAEPGTWWLAEPGEEPYELGPGWPPEAGETAEAETAETAEPEAAEEAEELLPPPSPPVPVVAVSQGGAHGFGPAKPEEQEEGPRAVPGGIWLGALPEVVGPLIGVTPDTYLLGVGSPARPALPTADLLARVPEEAADARHLLLAAPWADPSDLVAMAVALADELDRTVRAAIGLPVRTADDHATTFLDGRGAPTWQPLLLELAASPAHHRVVPSAWLRPSGPEAKGPALYVCTDLEGWVVELVPAGLWLRPADRQPDAAPRTRHPDPARPTLIVGDGTHPLPPELPHVLPGVLATLPDLGATEPYGLLFHGVTSDEDRVRGWAEELDLHWLGSTALSSLQGELEQEQQLELEQAPEAEPEREPAPEPAPEADPAPALPAPAVPAPQPATMLPAPGGRSGPDDRAALRELLGEKYHILASKAELLASRLPSLRSLAQDGLKADLVAIALYQTDAPDLGSRAGLAEAARAAGPVPCTPLLRCLDSGLRRLPGHYGAVMLAAPVEEVPLDRYAQGAVVVEPAAVAAVPACDAELEGAVEFGIWSTTGRRTSVFLGTDDEPEVVFPPGTAFSVLALQLSEDDTAPIRVLLREVSPAETDRTDERFRRRDEQALTRLTDWFERRDMLAPDDRRRLPDASRFHVAPGAGQGARVRQA